MSFESQKGHQCDVLYAALNCRFIYFYMFSYNYYRRHKNIKYNLLNLSNGF